MENKLPPKEFHVWTASDFIERRKDWNQDDETRLAEYLQQLSNKITQGAQNTLNELDDLVASVDDTAIQVANINNEFQLLADKQFIENKVQEEDETVQLQDEKFVANKTNGTDVLESNLKEALKNSFKAIDIHFEKVTVVVSDSDDDDDDELNHEETILRPRPFYKKLNLPSLGDNTQTEIAVDNPMSSDSDSEVELPTNIIIQDKMSSSNGMPGKNINLINESTSLQESNSQFIETDSNIFEPEKPISKNIPNSDNLEDDLFQPPPLINDNDDEDLENEYNIFGNGNSNVYGEDDDYDDDAGFSNKPSLPIYSDKPPLLYSEEPPQQTTKSIIKEKVEVPSVQQSLNDELKKRFQKDNTSSSDNLDVESSKIKIPKGAVNILGGTDTKPYITSPVQNTKQSSVSQINPSMVETIQNKNVCGDFQVSNKFDDSSQNLVSSTHKDLKKEAKAKKNLFFEQESDDDLFVAKTSNAVPTPKAEISEKEKPFKNVKLSGNIFSESDSDEDFINSTSATKEIASHSTKDNSTKTLDSSSSDDDLFNIKPSIKEPNKKSELFSSQVCNDSVIKSKQIHNEIKQKTTTSVEKNSVKQILNEDIFSEAKNNIEESSVGIKNTDTRNIFSPNNDTLNSNIIGSASKDNTLLKGNQQSSNSQCKKKINTLFSSDEDDLDDDTFFNVSKSNQNNVKKDQLKNNSTELFKSENELNEAKVEMFNSSSDEDDIFNNKKSNNNSVFTNISTQNDSNEIEIKTKPNDTCTIVNQVENTVKISTVEKKTNVFSLLSDDEEEDICLSFDSTISDGSPKLYSSQKINESIKNISTSTEEFFSPQFDPKNKDIFLNSSGEVFDNKNQELHDKKKVFSSVNDELSLSSNNPTTNSKKETIEVHSTSNSSPENLIDSKKPEPFSKKVIDIFNAEKLHVSKESTVQENKSTIFSSSDDDEQQLLINSNDLNENLKKIEIGQTLDNNTNFKTISSKDSIDGSSFSSISSKNETTKKLPGKLNKNAGAFINIASLLPNSKGPMKVSDITKSVSIDKNNDGNLPSSEKQLFIAEKERAKIQVKRRPQSRKARIAAARMSSIEIGHESNIEESSRLFGSTSDLTVSDSNSDLYGSSKKETSSEIDLVDNKFDEKLPQNKLVHGHLKEIESIKEKSLDSEPINKKQVKTLNVNELEKNKSKSVTQDTILSKKTDSLFNFDESCPFESSQEEASGNEYFENEENTLDEKVLEFTPAHRPLQEIDSVSKTLADTEPVSITQPETDSNNDIHSDIEPISNNQVKTLSVKEQKTNKSKSPGQQTIHSLFDDDEDDDDSDLFDSVKEETSSKYRSDNKEKTFDNKQFESKSVIQQLEGGETVDKGLVEEEPVFNKQPVIESISDKLSVTETTYENQDKTLNVKELVGENKSKSETQSTVLSNKKNSLFDDDDDDLFSPKSDKGKKPSSNIFDSDEEIEFNHKFTKRSFVKTKSIFGDDSDDDLFSSPSKPSASKLPSQKLIDKSSQRQNRSGTDGYVKLAAESVAINPLESKKN